MFFKVRRERARVASLFGTGEGSQTRSLPIGLGVSSNAFKICLQRLDNRDVPSRQAWVICGKSPLDRLEAESNQEQALFELQFEHSVADAVPAGARGGSMRASSSSVKPPHDE